MYFVYLNTWHLLFAGGGGLASYTPSKVDLTSEGFELGVTRAVPVVVPAPASTGQTENTSEVEYLRPAQDAGAWGSETTGDLLYWKDEDITNARNETLTLHNGAMSFHNSKKEVDRKGYL